MGNCMETCDAREKEETQEGGGDQREGGGDQREAGIGKEGGNKVKILLTRGELEWLVLQLKEKGERRLEDVLMEITKERRGRDIGETTTDQVCKWKPSLESIIERPEVQSFDEDSRRVSSP